MSIFQKAAIALARVPAPAAHAGHRRRQRAGQPLCRRPTAGQAAATRAARAARHPRLAVLSGEYVADPAIIEQTVEQTVAACRALEAAGLDVHVD